MSVTLLEQPPPTVPRRPGPYRRDDYAALPDEPRCELIYGRFYLSPSPVRLHQFLVMRIWRVLDDAARAVGGEALVAPMDVHLAEHTVAQPDVLYVSPERQEILQTWIEGAPDLVVEVLSPSTARMDRLLKLNRYAEAGVREYWLVDPVAANDRVPDQRRRALRRQCAGWRNLDVPCRARCRVGHRRALGRGGGEVRAPDDCALTSLPAPVGGHTPPLGWRVSLLGLPRSLRGRNWVRRRPRRLPRDTRREAATTLPRQVFGHLELQQLVERLRDVNQRSFNPVASCAACSASASSSSSSQAQATEQSSTGAFIGARHRGGPGSLRRSQTSQSGVAVREGWRRLLRPVCDLASREA